VVSEIVAKAKAARAAALKLANIPTDVKNKALLEMASAIARKRREILDANMKDVEAADALVKKGKLSKAFVDRLKLSTSKIDDIVEGIKSVARLDDPVGKTLYSIELDNGLELYRVSCPIGVIGAIFESRPDALPQISSLCLKSGNAVLLKGGSEAKFSNEALFKTIAEATESAGIPEGWIQLAETREDVKEMLKCEGCIDLFVPRGSKEFVKYVQENTCIPVLGHSEGICHVYVDKAADLNKALNICFDAKVQYPAACNAVETLLVHKDIAEEFLPRIAEKYAKAGVEIRGCERTMKILQGRGAKEATEKDWATEYLDLVISIKVVDGLDDAIAHINAYGSKHTDTIVTEDKKAALKFLEMVDSSTVMHNASTRFSDGYRYGLGAEVGISTGKIHVRGPAGLESLVTYKYLLLGAGQTVGEYIGPDAKRFTHRKLQKSWDERAKNYKE